MSEDYLAERNVPELMNSMLVTLLKDRPDGNIHDYLLAWFAKLRKPAVTIDANTKPADALGAVSWFRSLKEIERQAFATHLIKKEFKAGEVIEREGDTSLSAVIVLNGQVSRTKKDPDGNNQAIATATNGDVLGLLHLIDQSPAYSTSTAVTDVGAYILTEQSFTAVMSGIPTIQKAFIAALAVQVRSYSKVYMRKPDVNRSQSPSHTINVVLFDSKSYWEDSFNKQNEAYDYNLTFIRERLSPQTAALANEAQVVCCFVNDDLCGETLYKLHLAGVQVVAMRCAGFDRLDVSALKTNNMLACRVPAYSPYATAEHALALALALNRKLAKASRRTKCKDFRLEGLLGFDFRGKTAGVVGTGKIGYVFINLLRGFGMRVLCCDPYPNKEIIEKGWAEYVPQEQLFKEADIISLHAPLMEATKHIVNKDSIATMKKGVLIINCGRGGLVDTKALIAGLQSGHIGGAGLDVYENESEFFFSDHSHKVCNDTDLGMMLQMPNVVLTAHQAFFTQEGVGEIARVTLENIKQWSEGIIADHPNRIG